MIVLPTLFLDFFPKRQLLLSYIINMSKAKSTARNAERLKITAGTNTEICTFVKEARAEVTDRPAVVGFVPHVV